MNLHAAIAVAAATLFAGQAAIALWIAPRVRVNQLASALAVVLMVWNVGSALQLVATSEAEARFWWRVSAVGFMWGGAFFWHFALSLSEHRGVLGRPWAVMALYLSGFVLWIWFITTDALIARFVHQPFGWHFVFAEGAGPIFFVAYYGGTTGAAFLLLLRWGWSSADRRHRRQVLWICGVGAPAVGLATVTNLVLPLAGIHDVPPAAPAAFALWGVGFLWAIGRHRLMRLSPAVAAEQIFRASGEGLVLLDVEGRAAAANPAALRLLGTKEHRFLGADLGDLEVLSDLELSPKGGKQQVSFRRADAPGLPSSSGMGRPSALGEAVLEVSHAEVRDELGQPSGWALMLRDISEAKALEQQLLQLGKLEAVGQLAAGVAHDFNNVLAAILGYTQMLRDNPDDPTLVREAAEVIEQAGQRASGLTEQLLGFGRGGKHRVEVVDLHALIEEVRRLLLHTIDKQIDIEAALEASPPHVMGDPGQLQQVLLNLALNARDAMPQGGQLRFHTELALIDGAVASSLQLEAGLYLRCSVADSGEGLSEEARERLFEPFFSTKEDGKGMGLAMSFGIVRNHGGAIRVRSEEGRGTKVMLFLPHVAAAEVAPASDDERSTEAKAESEEPAPPEATAEGHGDQVLVLVVDDEEMLRRSSRRLLRRLGYGVAVVAGGAEALAYLEAHPGEVGLVLLDLVMPGLCGLPLLVALRELEPDVGVVVCSGYDRDGRVQELLDAGARGFVQKPYSMPELEAALAAAEKGAQPS